MKFYQDVVYQKLLKSVLQSYQQNNGGVGTCVYMTVKINHPCMVYNCNEKYYPYIIINHFTPKTTGSQYLQIKMEIRKQEITGKSNIHRGH